MRTAYGKQMPAHCAEYFDGAAQASRRLSCLRLERAGGRGRERGGASSGWVRPSADGGQRLYLHVRAGV